MTNSGKDKKSKRKIITRRGILVSGGALLGTAVLGTGGYIGYGLSQRFSRDALSTIPDHRVPMPITFPKMVIVHGQDPATNVRAALGRLGGMGRFIGREDIVVIKPNIGWERLPVHAANTHPDVVAEVIRACKEINPTRLIVSDCPVTNSKRAFEMSGILAVAKELGVEAVMPENSRFLAVKISSRLGAWDILEPFVIATKIINIPVAKHHDLTGVTAGMKNWIGITTKLRMLFHNDIQKSIAELAGLMLPTLTVLDATRVIMSGGPRGGNLGDVKAFNTVAIGIDPVALDVYANTLFQTKPQALPKYLSIASEMGLGTQNFKSLSPVEITT